ncbi:hypothetical protein B0H16DRAFT_1459662 [Mycena metata]|uniref:Uncharacterized protein n=1 Tax=Mycena metata TaxID=1033252 RepID=A0AAD7IY28_9AGAR|nr:hypothetical protein B0H16DRAFT_1459662 [Mycena metata]
MFYFDTLVHGVHGHALAADLSEEESSSMVLIGRGFTMTLSYTHSAKAMQKRQAGLPDWDKLDPLSISTKSQLNRHRVHFTPTRVTALEAVIPQWCGLAANLDIIHFRSIALAFCRILSNTAF